VLEQVRRGARTPEAHLALEDGLHYDVSQDAVVAYQVRRRTAFCIGGLNALPHRRLAVVAHLLRHLREEGIRRTLFFPLRAPDRADAAAAGLSSLQVGVEGWLNLQTFHTQGRPFEHLRQMCNRARRRGVLAVEDTQAHHRAAMAEVYDAWLESKRPSWRMRLLVGSPGLDHPYDRRYFVATTEGRLEAFVTVLPGGPGQWGVDVMCRRPDAVPGTMELLLLHVVHSLQDEGAERLSLGPCPMAGVERHGDRPLLRWTFHALYSSTLGNSIFGFRNLHRFKQKFRPTWEPVFFGASRLGPLELYLGCRMWGLY
jgi:phosphatidylglycerol lysyltransferase